MRPRAGLLAGAADQAATQSADAAHPDHVRARGAPRASATHRAVELERDRVRLRAAAVEGDDQRCSAGGHRAHCQVLAVVREQQVGEPLGPVVLPDERMRQHRAQHPVAAAVHGRVERQPLVAGDVGDEPRVVGGQRVDRQRGDAARIRPSPAPR